jgi:hypothetical protein
LVIYTLLWCRYCINNKICKVQLTKNLAFTSQNSLTKLILIEVIGACLEKGLIFWRTIGKIIEGLLFSLDLIVNILIVVKWNYSGT